MAKSIFPSQNLEEQIIKKTANTNYEEHINNIINNNQLLLQAIINNLAGHLFSHTNHKFDNEQNPQILQIGDVILDRIGWEKQGGNLREILEE